MFKAEARARGEEGIGEWKAGGEKEEKVFYTPLSQLPTCHGRAQDSSGTPNIVTSQAPHPSGMKEAS